jgi:hypothetical protein
VRSYRTISPLPDIAARRYLFCGTFRRAFRPARPLAGTLPCGDRTFLPQANPGATTHPATLPCHCPTPRVARLAYSGRMAVLRAALGFRMHTGWAALVAVAYRPGKIEILLRRRLELLPADGSIPRFVYHTAAEMDGRKSATLVKDAAAASNKTARAALKEIVEMLRRLDVSVEAAAVPVGSTKIPAELARILAAHPLIHAAEGALFRQSVTHACQSCGLKILSVREREVLPRAAEACGSDLAQFSESLNGLRVAVGPPWGADQKTATAAALLALSARAPSAPRSGSPESLKC